MSARYAAAIFDLDGTLVDNMAFHLQAWVELGRKLGVEITAERFERDFAGRKNDEIFPRVLGRPVPQEELQRLAGEKEARYRELYAAHLRPLPGAEALLERLRALGLKLAVASAAPAENRAFVLEGLGWTKRFDAVIGGEMAARGKPAPDIFLAAARALSVEPSSAIAFEDAVLGVRAARAAGMEVAAVTTTADSASLEAAGARWTAADFERLPAELVTALLGR